MRRTGLALWACTLIAFLSHEIRSVVATEAQANEIDRVLTDWHAHSSKITSLKVDFRATKYSKSWGNSESSGSLLLALPNLAQLDCPQQDAQGKPTGEVDRVVWSGGSQSFFTHSTNSVMKINYPEVMDQTPRFLSLFFLFGMTIEQAKSEHNWTILRENDSEFVLQAIARSSDAGNIFHGMKLIQSFVITLDKKTFLPKSIVILPESRGVESADKHVFRVTEIKVNPTVDVERIRNPEYGDWKLDEVNAESFARFRKRVEKFLRVIK